MALEFDCNKVVKHGIKFLSIITGVWKSIAKYLFTICVAITIT